MKSGKPLLVIILLTGGGLVLFFSWKISQDLPTEHLNDTTWGLLTGIIIITAGLLLLKSNKLYKWCENKISRIGNWLGVSPWQVLLLMFSPILAVLATNAAGLWIRMYSPYAAVATWLMGIACAIFGGWNWEKEKPRITRTTIIYFTFVTILGFIVRGVGTGQIPILLSGDEGSAGINAVDFVRGEWNNLFITGWFAFPSLFPFIQSLSIRIFGQTTEALRLPSALAGALTVGAVYVCGKEMFNQRAGLLAAFFLAAFHFHIHFSRLGINNIWDGLWFTFVIGALWYGWKNDHRGAYVLAGLGLGLSQYFYTSSRALIGIALIAGLIVIFFQHTRLRLVFPHFLLATISAMVVIAPLAWFYINEPNQFMSPISRVSILGNDLHLSNAPAWKTLFQQLALGMGAYTHTPILFWYAPETPLLRPIPIILFYTGLVYLVVGSRDARLLLLSLWLIAFGVMGGLSDFTPAAQRYVASAPACALIIGYGLYKLGSTLEDLGHISEKLVTILVFGVMAIAMTSDLYFYFIEYTSVNQIDNISSNGMIAQQLANYLKGKPPGTIVAFLGTPDMGYYSIPSTRYLTPQVTGIEVTVPWESFDHSQLTGKKVIFIFLPEREDEIEAVTNEFPNGQLEEQKAWNNQVIFWAYDWSSN